MDVSIIVRFHDEEQYLEPVLRSVTEQSFPKGEFELIAVDNCSTDRSREIARRFTNHVVTIDDYQPGKALNRAIRGAQGQHIAIVSAHVIPADRRWLAALFRHMGHDGLAGVYGAQLYPLHSKFLDKRDLDIFSTLQGRTETEDSDFWNANSMFPRAVWERQPFEETVYELEDHLWSKQLLPRGYHVEFEPAALAYHYGHIQRLDREYLPKSSLTDEQRIEEAAHALKIPDADWPTVMRAGLTLSSLTHVPLIVETLHAIGTTYRDHPDFDVRWRMAQALGKIRDLRSVDYLLEGLSDPSFYPRDETAWSLARLGDLAAGPLIERAEEYAVDVRPFVALALGRSGSRLAEPVAVGVLLGELRTRDVIRQRHAAYFAGEIADVPGAADMVSELNCLLDTDDVDLLHVVCWALGCFAPYAGDQVAWQQLCALAESHPHLLTRFEATVAMGKLVCAGWHPGLEFLLSRLSDEESRVRYGAMQSIRLVAELRPDASAFLEHLEGFSDDDYGVMYERDLALNWIGSVTAKQGGVTKTR